MNAKIDRARRAFAERHELTDAIEAPAKLPLPTAFEQRLVDALPDREKKFEVLTIAERVSEGWPATSQGDRARGCADGNQGGIEDRFSAKRCDSVEIFGEAIAEIDHGMDLWAGGEPGAFLKAGRETMMFTEQASAERPGHVDPISGARAGAGQHSLAGGFTDEREAGGDDVIGLSDIAADNGDAVGARARGEAAIKFLQPIEARVRIDREGDDRGAGLRAHGCEIAEIAFKELRADRARRDRIVEMPAIDHRIDCDGLGFF